MCICYILIETKCIGCHKSNLKKKRKKNVAIQLNCKLMKLFLFFFYFKIKGLNQSQTMEGCSAPLVVKFADTQREKEQKKFHQMHTSIFSTIKGTNGVGAANTLGLTTGVTISDPITNSITTNGNSASANAANILGLTGSSMQGNSLVLPNATALTSNAPLMTNPPQACNPFIGADALSSSSLQFLQQMQAVGLQQQFLQGILTVFLL